MSTTIAVVLPCYLQARFLPDALASLEAQTRRPDHVVVVDDGSPDNVEGAVEPFEGVELIQQENRGLSQARNRGLGRVDTDFVLFLDSDDRLRPEALEVLERALVERPEAAFAWGFNEPNDVDWNPMPWGPTWFEGEPNYEKLLERNAVGAPLGVLFRRAAVAELGGFDASLPAVEDYDMYLRLAREHPYVCVHRVIADYRHHGGNMSQDHPLMYRSHIEVLERQDPWVQGDPVLEAARRRGVRSARRHFLAPVRLERVANALERQQWVTATREAIGLMVRHPGVFTAVVRRRLGGR